MTEKNIRRITICRHGGERPVWNIMMFVCPEDPSEAYFGYAMLVKLAETTLREVKGLTTRDGWYVSNAEIMAWSGSRKTNVTHFGPYSPHEFRISLDIENSKDSEQGPEDE